MSGLFGSLFDFNGDGELSTGEKAFGFAAIMSALSALEDAEVSVSCSFDDEDLDDMDRDELEANWKSCAMSATSLTIRSRTILAAMPTMSGRSDVKISMKRSRKSKNCWMTDGGNL